MTPSDERTREELMAEVERLRGLIETQTDQCERHCRSAESEVELLRAQVEPTKPPGSTREAMWGTCAAEPCDENAAIEVLHRPNADESCWVPLCVPHHEQAGVVALEYMVVAHGFVYPLDRS